MKLVRAISSNNSTVSLTFDDGLAGVLPWLHVLVGTGLVTGKVRVESVRPAPDGSALQFEVGIVDERGKQQPDQTKLIDAHELHALLSREENAVLSFTVQGQYGPTTLTFKPLGKHAYAAATVTEEDARTLTAEEVQEWYTSKGYPRAGWLSTYTPRGFYRGQFQLL